MSYPRYSHKQHRPRIEALRRARWKGGHRSTAARAAEDWLAAWARLLRQMGEEKR